MRRGWVSVRWGTWTCNSQLLETTSSMELSITSINVGSRIRQDMGDIEALARSIEEIGLLQAVGVDAQNNLIFGHRRLQAFQRLGRNSIPARVISITSLLAGEHAENEMRKDFTVSERVAIGKALEAELGNRRGLRTDLGLVQEIAQVEPGAKTRELAAEKAGFGNPETYRQAKKVVDQAAPEIVAAVDAGTISVSLAAQVAELPKAEQAPVAALKDSPAEMREAAKEAVHNHRAQGTGENEWYTPAEYVEAAREVLGEIDLDPASSEIANARVRAKSFYSIDDDGLSKQWTGRVWLNPPYAQPAIHQFIEKLCSEVARGGASSSPNVRLVTRLGADAGGVSEAILLTHNYTDTRWFHLAAEHAAAICFTRGRIGFLSPEGKRAAPTQGQAFFYFGPNHRAFSEAFSRFGFVVEVARGYRGADQLDVAA